MNDNAELYQRDFYEWSRRSAELIRSGQWSALDPESIAEEIESLGRSDKREAINRLKVLIMHLLKWQFQVDRRSGSWRSTIRTQRTDLLLVLEESPSLFARIDEWIALAYPTARQNAVDEMGLLQDPLPETCPFTAEQILDPDFWP